MIVRVKQLNWLMIVCCSLASVATTMNRSVHKMGSIMPLRAILSSKLLPEDADITSSSPGAATIWLVNRLMALLGRSKSNRYGVDRYNGPFVMMNSSCPTGVTLKFIELLSCMGVRLQKTTTLTATFRVMETTISGSTPITIGGCVPANFPYPICSSNTNSNEQQKDSLCLP